MKKTIQVRMSEEDIDRLKKEAERRGLTLSAFIRWYIKELLKR